jgi:hypothetical protein
MPVETTAQASALSGTPDEDDYQAFCQTLSASERGRAFLAEYARRNRNADTEQLLAAIEQLQSVMVAQPAPQGTDLVKRQLRELLDEIGTAQCELDELLLATKTEALANLIARVESRISRILWSLRADAASEVETSPPASEAPANQPKNPSGLISPSCRYPTNLNCQFHRQARPARRPSHSCAARPNWRKWRLLKLRPSRMWRARISQCRAKESQPTQTRLRPVHCHRSCRGLRTNGWHCLRRAIHAAIRRANISTSTLPPDRIPTTILPFTSIFPASNAARPITPPGSTTSFSSVKA